MITDIGHSGTALAIGSIASNRPQFLRIGSGSGAELATITGLYAEVGSPRAFTQANIGTQKEVTWQADWPAPWMSGLKMREFCLSTGSADDELWNYENLGADIEFDGSTELRIELKWTVY